MSDIVSPIGRNDARRTLIALHCSAAGGRAFDSYRGLLDVDNEFIAPDLLGSGAEAPWPLGAPLNLDAEAARLAPLLERAPDGVHLIGHSYGGAVALQLALRQPERVLSLTLYEPVRFRLLSSRSSAWHEISGLARRVEMLTASGNREIAAQRFIDYWSGDGTWSTLPSSRRSALADRMPTVCAEFGALFGDEVTPEAYAGLTMPIAVLTGERSPAPARQVAHRLSNLCPNALLVRLPGRGHMGALEDPAAVLQHGTWAAAELAQTA